MLKIDDEDKHLLSAYDEIEQLNVNEIDCGGHSTLIFVALPNGPSPECRALK